MILGPLTNAAKAQRVVIGVFDESLVDLMAESLMEIGSVDHGVIVHGCGLDEISPLGPSTIVEIKAIYASNVKTGYSKERYEFDPLTIGIPRCSLLELKGGNREENAFALREVLKAGNHVDAKRNSVLLNTGVGVYVYGLASSIAEGVEIARRTLFAGSAEKKLEEWIGTTQRLKAENN
jgi:anthranilate phosphoribosyltransferase